MGSNKLGSLRIWESFSWLININLWYFAFTQPLRHGQDVIQGQFLCGAQLFWIQSFPYSRPTARVKWKTQINSYVYT